MAEVTEVQLVELIKSTHGLTDAQARRLVDVARDIAAAGNVTLEEAVRRLKAGRPRVPRG